MYIGLLQLQWEYKYNTRNTTTCSNDANANGVFKVNQFEKCRIPELDTTHAPRTHSNTRPTNTFKHTPHEHIQTHAPRTHSTHAPRTHSTHAPRTHTTHAPRTHSNT
ncbi:hypothetical protein EGW08_001866, partial [Elysia chlorotica]